MHTTTAPVPGMIQTAEDADGALRTLLRATLLQESLITARDAEIAAVMTRHSSPMAQAAGEIAALEQALESYYVAHAPTEGKKWLQLTHGCIGMRTPSNPALIPLNDKWDWEKIAKKLKRLFKLRFFHKPKPPGIDKVKVKRELGVEQLAKCGLALDTAESFYIDLNRVAVADKYQEAA